MTTLADKAILSGADNRPPMLEKDMYDSWKSIIELYMMNRQHGRIILESVENGPLIWPSIKENGVTRPKKYSELFATEAIQADCDIKATNIILQGLPPEVYALVINHKVTKELWEIIQLFMQGTSLTKQERECKLYDEFDKFAYKKGEILRDLYLRFSLLLNDMNIYNMKLEQFQVNTKFLNTLPPKWSKFMTDVKLVRDLHTTNIDQLHAFLGQHEFHANEGRHTPFTMGTTRTYTPRASGSNFEKQRTLICYNCKGEGHMSKQSPKQPLKRGNGWIHVRNDKVLLVQAQANDALAEVHNHDNVNNNMINQAVQAMPSSEQSNVAAVQNSSSFAQQDALILSVIEQLNTKIKEQVKVLKEGQNVDLKSKDNVLNSSAQSVVIDRLKQTLYDHLKEKESLMQTNSVNSSEPTLSSRPTKVEVPKELPKAADECHKCKKCLKLETMLLKEKGFRCKKRFMINCSKVLPLFEKHCISLEVDTQLNQEIFQRDNSVSNQSAPSFDQLFELNELKAQSQEKDMVIKKLKERIKSLSGKINEDKIKKDLEEIETINMELDHRVSKLIAENKHLKQTYKQLYNSIKPARIDKNIL
ncbi:hypothetical protein Tco_1292384 [Tanacetum coccineum]